MHKEIRQALRFIGTMFVGVGLFGVLTSMRSGLNVLAVMAGALGVGMFAAVFVTDRIKSSVRSGFEVKQATGETLVPREERDNDHG